MKRFLPLLTVTVAAAAALQAAPPEPKALLKPTNLAVNTKADEDEPHAASNGLTLYYASKPKDQWELMQSTRSAPGQPWRAGEPIDFGFALETEAKSVFVTPEGRFPQFLFFSTLSGKHYTLFGTLRNFPGKPFGSPTVMGIEDTQGDELHPWLTPDGKQLYFSRKTDKGWRVFVTSRASESGLRGFGKPALLEELPPDFHHATLTPDGRTMFLQGPLEGGRWGLFRSVKTGTGWGMPEALDTLNHPEGPTGDRSPNLSRDGSVLYFASDRPGGKGGLDLWWIATKDLPPAK